MKKDKSLLLEGFNGQKCSSLDELLSEYDWRLRLAYLPRELSGNFNGLAQKLVNHLNLGKRRTAILSLYDYTDIELRRFSVRRVFDELSSDLDEEEKKAAQCIITDLEGTEGKTNLCLEGIGLRPPTSRYHHDLGFSQGRLLCAYNSTGTVGVYNEDVIKKKGQIYDIASEDSRIFEIPLGFITRHTIKIEDGNFKHPQKTCFIHRRGDADEEYPRLLMRGH